MAVEKAQQNEERGKALTRTLILCGSKQVVCLVFAMSWHRNDLSLDETTYELIFQGKTTMLNNLLERNLPARPTLALEYSFGRKQNRDGVCIACSKISMRDSLCVAERMAETLWDALPLKGSPSFYFDNHFCCSRFFLFVQVKDTCNFWELGGGTAFTAVIPQLIYTPLKEGRMVSVGIVLDLSKPPQLWLTFDKFIRTINTSMKKYAESNPDHFRHIYSKRMEKFTSEHPNHPVKFVSLRDTLVNA